MTDRALMQIATYSCGVCGVSMRMEQPAQQEPVAKPYAYEYGRCNGDGTYSVVIEKGDLVQIKPAVYDYVRPRNAHKDWPVKELFDRPQAREPLTDEEIKDVAASCMWWVQVQDILADAIELARAIEQAHGIIGEKK